MKQLDLEALIDWDEYFLNQAAQGGHGLQHFSGQPQQRGFGLGSIFQSLFRFLIPIGKTIGSAIGKEALHTGTNIAADLLDGHKLSDALKSRGRESGKKLVSQAQAHLAQSGRGRPKGSKNKKKVIKKRPTKKKIIHTQRKRANVLLSDDIFN